MKRLDKINLLQGIKNGELSILAICPPKVYVFTELTEPRRYIDKDKKEYSLQEYEDFCKKIEKINTEIINSNPVGKKNIIITLAVARSKKVL